MMSLLNLIDKLADKKPEPFVAPVPFAQEVTVRTIQDSVPYRFSVQNPRPGWWTLIPQGKLSRIDKPAAPSDVIDYLNQLPRFYVIALYPTSETTWLVVPYSIADAAQRGWKDGQPREVHLVRMAVESFDVLVTRSLAGTLIFDDIDTRLGTHTITSALREALATEGKSVSEANWRNAWNTVYLRYQQVAESKKKAEMQARIIESRLTDEEAIRFQLEFMGASLRDIQTTKTGYTVGWTSPDGRTYDMRVGHNLHIEVAGLCLSGQDNMFNLSAMVSIMERAEELHRPIYGITNTTDDEVDYDDD